MNEEELLLDPNEDEQADETPTEVGDATTDAGTLDDTAPDRAPAGGADTPVVAGQPQQPQIPQNGEEVLKNYFLSQAKNKQDLAAAQKTANENRLIAQIGQAGAQIGQGIAKAPQLNMQPWQNLQANAEQPVADLQQRQAMDNSSNKMLQDYFMKKAGMDLTGRKLDQAKGIADQTSIDRNKRTDAITELGKGRLAMAGQGLDLRKGNQAIKISDKFVNDPVVKVTNTQQANIDKALGRIRDIKEGRQPFTSTIKADIEKDIANAISGGNNSSLAMTERTEFNPYSARWAKIYGEATGVQKDIGAPAYVDQMEKLLNGLKGDIGVIQQGRVKKLSSGYKNAVKNNPLALQSIEDNVNTASGPAPVKPAKMQQADWDALSDAGKAKAVKHFGG